MQSQRAIKIGVIHLLIVGLSLALLFSPLGNKPGAINPILLPFFFYCLFSFILPAVGVFISLKAIFRKEEKSKIAIALSLNGIYLIIYFGFIVHMWPRWMGI